MIEATNRYGSGVVRVTMSGTFGKFRTRASDVKIEPTHVALVFAGAPAAEDLDFEPPLEQGFDLELAMSEDGVAGKPRQVKHYRVAHFGLRTRLDELGVTVIVLPLDKKMMTKSNVVDSSRTPCSNPACLNPACVVVDGAAMCDVCASAKINKPPSSTWGHLKT